MEKTDAPSGVGKLALLYSRNPVVEAFLAEGLGALPGGGVLDRLLSERADQIARKRSRTFYAALAEGRMELSPELLESEDFLHRFIMTAQAVLRTRRHEKIRLFARLFQSGWEGDQAVEADEYEELLGILNELSYRELQILQTMDEFQERSAGVTDAAQRVEELGALFWEMERRTGVPQQELPALIQRIERTGLFKARALRIDENGQAVEAYDALLGFGELTARFTRLKQLVLDGGFERSTEGDVPDARAASGS